MLQEKNKSGWKWLEEQADPLNKPLGRLGPDEKTGWEWLKEQTSSLDKSLGKLNPDDNRAGWEWLENQGPEKEKKSYLDELTENITKDAMKPPDTAPVAAPEPRTLPIKPSTMGMPTKEAPKPLGKEEPKLSIFQKVLNMIGSTSPEMTYKREKELPSDIRPAGDVPWKLPEDPREIVSEIGKYQGRYQASKERLKDAQIDVKRYMAEPGLWEQLIGLSILAKRKNWAVFFEQFDAVANRLTFGNADTVAKVVEEIAHVPGLRDVVKERSKERLTKEFGGFYPEEGVDFMKEAVGFLGSLPAYGAVLTGAGALTSKIAIPALRKAATGIVGGAAVGMLEKPEDDSFINRLKQVPPSVAFFTLFEMGALTGESALKILRWKKAFKKGKFGEGVTADDFKDIARKMTANVKGAGEALSQEEKRLYMEVADIGALRKAIKEGVIKLPRKPRYRDIFKKESSIPEFEYRTPRNAKLGEAQKAKVSEEQAVKMFGKAQERVKKEWKDYTPQERLAVAEKATEERTYGTMLPDFVKDRAKIIEGEKLTETTAKPTIALGKYIAGETGTTKLPEILDHFIKKYDIKTPIKLVSKGREPGDWRGKGGANLRMGRTKGRPNERYEVTVLSLPELEEANKFSQIGTLTHEVQHVIDAEKIGSVEGYGETLTSSQFDPGRHFLDYKNFEGEVTEEYRRGFLSRGEPAPMSPETEAPMGKGYRQFEKGTYPKDRPTPTTTEHKPPEPVDTGPKQIKVERDDKGGVVLTIPGAEKTPPQPVTAKAARPKEAPEKQPGKIEVERTLTAEERAGEVKKKAVSEEAGKEPVYDPTKRYRLEEREPEQSWIDKQRELPPDRKRDYHKPHAKTADISEERIAAGEKRYERKKEAMKALQRYARKWGYTQKSTGGLAYNKILRGREREVLKGGKPVKIRDAAARLDKQVSRVDNRISALRGKLTPTKSGKLPDDTPQIKSLIRRREALIKESKAADSPAVASTLRLGKKKKAGFTFKQLDSKGNVVKEAPIASFLKQPPRKVQGEGLKQPPKQLELEKEAKKRGRFFTEKEWNKVEDKLGASGESLTDKEIEQLTGAGLYEEFPSKMKEPEVPPDVKRAARVLNSRPTIKLGSNQVFITNPAGEKTFLGWLPTERARSLKEEARKLQITDKLDIEEAEARVWDDYLNPADKEEEMKAYLKEASEEDLEKWEAFRNNPAVKEVEEKIKQYNLFEKKVNEFITESSIKFEDKPSPKVTEKKKKVIDRVKLALEGKKRYRPRDIKKSLEGVDLELPEPAMEEIERLYAEKFFKDYKKKATEGATIQGVVKTLRNAGVSDSIINEYKFNGKPATSLIRIKKLPNGRQDIVLTKDIIEHIRENYNTKIPDDFSSRWTLRYWKYFARGQVLAPFKPAQLYFKALGLEDVLFTPMRVGEREGFNLFKEDFEPTIKKIFKGLSKKERKEFFRYMAGRQGRGPQLSKAGYKVLKLSDLNEKQRKALAKWNDFYKRIKPALGKATDLTKNETTFLREYFPMYAKKTWKKMGGRAEEYTEAEASPWFQSLISRKQDVNFKTYEQDAYKNAWEFGSQAANFIKLSERVAKIEYLMESPEFGKLVTREDGKYIRKWFDYMFKPKGEGNKILQLARRAGYRSYFGLAVRPGLKQLLSYLDFLALEPSMWTKQSKEVKSLVKRLPLASIGERMPFIATADMTSKVDRALLWLVIAVDKKVAGGLRRMIGGELEQLKREGVDIHDNTLLRKIINEKSDRMDLIAGGVTAAQIPEVFRSDTGKLALMFQSTINSRIHTYVHDLNQEFKKIGAGEAKPRDVASIAKIITGFLLTAYLENVITKAALDADDAEEAVKEISFAAAGNTPTIGAYLYGTQAGHYDVSPISASIGETARLIGKIRKGDKGVTTGDLAFRFAELGGLPRQVRRTKEGVELIKEGGKKVGGGKARPAKGELSKWQEKYLSSIKGEEYDAAIERYKRQGKKIVEGGRIPIEGVDEIARVFLYGPSASRRVQKHYDSKKDKTAVQRNVAKSLERAMTDNQIRALYGLSGEEFKYSLRRWIKKSLSSAEYKYIKEREKKWKKRGLKPLSLLSIRKQLETMAKESGVF